MIENTELDHMSAEGNTELIGRLRADIAKWEAQDLEFTQELPDNVRELEKEIAAFATSNAATIYLGVDNEGNIVGVRGVSNLEDTSGKDEYSKRIQGISQALDPPLRVSVAFIDCEGRIVVRIDVPKGSEPVYYVGGVPYLRDITASRPARSVEVKEIHQRYFQATRPAPPNPKQNFIRRLIEQLSDVRLLLFDYRDHLIRPDINQMLYDLGASGRIILSMSSESPAKQFGMEEQLVKISGELEELESHRFYIGSESVNEFGQKAGACLDLSMFLFNQARKNADKGPLIDYAQMVNGNIDLLRKEWERREMYLKRGDIERLREDFRRYGFVFYRFGNYPEAEYLASAGQNLRTLGEELRNLSSVQKYFIHRINLLEIIQPRFSVCAQLMDSIAKEIETATHH